MPLLKGKANIGHNIEEMEEHGHPKKQAVAAALHTALDKEEDSEEGTINSKLTKSAQAKGVIMSHDDHRPTSTTAMTVADINARNTRMWGGEDGNLGTPEIAQGRARPIPVYDVHGADEVAPTQSDPPDTRSDNLLERAHGGADAYKGFYHGVEVPGNRVAVLKGKTPEASEERAKKLVKLQRIHKKNKETQGADSVVSGYKAGKYAGEKLAEGEVGDGARSPEEMEAIESKRPHGTSIPPATPYRGGATGGGKEGKKYPWPKAKDDLAMNTESMTPEEGGRDSRDDWKTDPVIPAAKMGKPGPPGSITGPSTEKPKSLG